MWDFRDLFCLKNIAERCFFRSNHYLLCHFADCNLICSKFIVCSPHPMFWVLWKLQLTQIPEVFQRNSRTVFLGWIRSCRKPKKNQAWTKMEIFKKLHTFLQLTLMWKISIRLSLYSCSLLCKNLLQTAPLLMHASAWNNAGIHPLTWPPGLYKPPSLLTASFTTGFPLLLCPLLLPCM